MTEELHQQIGRMLSSLESNTALTRDIAKDTSDIKEHLARLNSKVAAHEQYLGNLDNRVVKTREDIGFIREEMSFAKGAARLGGAVWGTASSIIVGVATYFITKS